MMILRNWSGCRNSRRNRFRARICRSCSWYRVWERKTMLHRLKRVTRTRLCSTRKCRFEARLGASGHVGPHATGPLASLCSPRTRSRRRLLTPARKAAARGGSACIAPRTRPRSGGPGPWDRRLCATLVAWGSSRAGWCPSTGPRRARLLFWLSTPTRTARCWSCEGRRKWCGPSNTTTSINNSFYNTTTITITTINITRTWCLMYPTVTITWSTNTWAPISGSLSSRC